MSAVQTRAMPALDTMQCPLDGVSLVEASAGTGKTWNICNLYLRLLIEQRRDVRDILVVTFSEKAAAELRERIRQRLAQMKAHWDGTPSDDGYTGRFAQTMLEHNATAADEGPLRVERALSAFDEAPIWTIHGFFHRALGEVPFAAHLPMDIELVTDDDSETLSVVRDAWRATVQAGQLPAALVDWIAEDSETPERLAELLERRMARPLSRLVWPEALNGVTLQQAFDRLQQASKDLEKANAAIGSAWRKRGQAIGQRLADAKDALHQRSYGPERLKKIAAVFDAIAAGHAPSEKDIETACSLTTASLQAGVKKGQQAPTDPFFGAVDAWQQRRAGFTQALLFANMAWRRDLLERLPPIVQARKRDKRVASFDDLLTSLHQCLFDPALPWLADRLRERFPVALIDEFQDTDPLQLAIFERIYGEAGGGAGAAPAPDHAIAQGDPAPSFTLFMVGDPKQAIYGFRNADLHAYLSARDRAEHQWSMTTNHRATPAMVAALNRLFTRNPRVFRLEGLDYVPVQAAGRQRARLVDARGPCALRVGLLPIDSAGGLPSPMLDHHQARRLAIAATVDEIVRLLEDGRAGQAGFETSDAGHAPLPIAHAPSARSAHAWTPISGGDIAVLVRTNRDAESMREALTAAGVGSVLASQKSVYQTEDALQLAQVLAACLDPGNEAAVRVALATEWIGMDALQIEAWALSEEQMQQWRAHFEAWHDAWVRRGVAAAMMRMITTCRTVQRLLPRIDGERRLTNLRHLVEGLQHQAGHLRTPRAQWKWLRAQYRNEGRASEDAQLRLESDRDLVQILTIHKSKGLEFPIVFLPLCWREPEPGGHRAALMPAEYHDDEGGRVIDFEYAMHAALGQRAECAQTDELLATESLAESTRLLYVAFTRAVHRCYVVAGEWDSKRRRPLPESSPLNRLIDAGSATAEPAEPSVTGRWKALADSTIDVSTLAAPTPRRLGAMASAGGSPRAAPLPARIDPGWRIDSYSGLIRRTGALPYEPAVVDVHAAGSAARSDLAAQDHENHIVATLPDESSMVEHSTSAQPEAMVRPDGTDGADRADVASVSGVAGVTDETTDMLAFPRGPAAGDCVHAVLEYADFTKPAQWPEAIAKALQYHPGFGEHAPAQLLSLLRHITATPLRDGLVLRKVPNRKRLNEWEFHLPATSLDPRRLQVRLEAHGYPCPPLDFARLEGYLKGFVDLLFEHGGRYWIVDWKSNHLGHTAADYGHDAMQAEMMRHEYHLQALLYAVAVERFLRQRIRRFDWDRHFGGVLYLFVRGVRPDWKIPAGGPSDAAPSDAASADARPAGDEPSADSSAPPALPAGVWFDRPSLEVVHAIGGTLDGR